MKDKLKDYFSAKKKESLLFIAIGILTISFGIACRLFFKGEFWMGLQYPLIALAIIQLAVGCRLCFRIRRQTKNLLLRLANAPRLFTEEELARMEKVNANFKIYRNAELLLFFSGLVFVFLGAFGDWGEFVLGFGFGLAPQSAILMVLGLFAEMRAANYTYEVISFKNRMLL